MFYVCTCIYTDIEWFEMYISIPLYKSYDNVINVLGMKRVCSKRVFTLLIQ